jgi:hypothetical protein
MFTLALTTVFGVAGMVTDFGWAYYRKQVAQAAAQSAALAAVKAGMTQGGVCGTGHVVCQSETACPASITISSSSSNVDKGCVYAQTNGFITSGRQKVTLETGPTTYNGVPVTLWAVAKVSEQVPQLFSIVTGNSFATLTARSAVGYVPPTAGGCIYVIAPTGVAFTSNGNTALNTGCGIWVNSSDSNAINLNGGNTTINATGPDGGVNIVGNYTCFGGTTGCITPTPNTGAKSAGDPLAGLDAPADSTCTAVPSGKDITLFPGTYCSPVNVNGGGSLTMNPGTYIFKGGTSCGLSASGNGSISGTGVTMYFEDSCSVSLTGNGAVNLSAPTTGMYQGILMFQARGNTTAASLTGGASQILNGVLYFPSAQLHYTGGTSSNINAPATTIITYNLQLTGNSFIWNAGSSPFLNTFSGYAILE